MTEIKFLGNASTALILDEEAWVVDALHDGASNYEPTPESTLTWLKNYSGKINFIVTHNHPDHFSARRYSELSKLRSFDFYAFDYDLIDEIKKVTDLSPDKIHYLRGDKDHELRDDLTLRGIVIPHLTPEHYPLKHVSLLFRWDKGEGVKRIFLTADASMDEEVYRRNGDHIHGCDICVAVFSYGYTSRNIAFVDRYIDPGLLVLNHLPNSERDKRNTRDHLVKYTEKNLHRDYHIFLDHGDEITL